MKRVLALALVGSLGLLGRAWAEDKKRPDNTPPEGFTALFNGKDLKGWQAVIPLGQRLKMSADEIAKKQKEGDEDVMPHWTVQDGVIVHDGKKGKYGWNISPVKDYGNFEYYVDWKIEKKGDSGIYLRGQPQVQIWDSDNLADNLAEDRGKGSGGLWNNPKNSPGQKPLVKADNPVGEWNTFYIKMVGDKVTVKLNGKLVVDNAPLANFWEKGKPLPAKGPIELQHHGDKLWFKNIYIKELPD
jgi:hypothetical protein